MYNVLSSVYVPSPLPRESGPQQPREGWGCAFLVITVSSAPVTVPSTQLTL